MEAQEAARCNREALPGIWAPSPRLPAGAVHRKHRAIFEKAARGRLARARLPKYRYLSIGPRHDEDVAGKIECPRLIVPPAVEQEPSVTGQNDLKLPGSQ